jgi:hypothetical protein
MNRRAAAAALAVACTACFFWPPARQAAPALPAITLPTGPGPLSTHAAAQGAQPLHWLGIIEQSPPAPAPGGRQSAPAGTDGVDAALEARQTARLVAAYRPVAEQRIVQLRADVLRAHALGIPEIEIRKLETKLRKLERLRDAASPVTGEH